ncbi:MAG: IS110 family transposase [Acidobacteriaceae bacterium]|nr:IS110 family transposase [Acidobacteriaceae bacterium]
MSKQSIQVQETMCCGIDVSAKSLTVAIQQMHQPVEQRCFLNTSVGHKALIAWLRKAKSPVRVSLEATGIYSLDLACALDGAQGIEVAVLNPKVANRFAQTIRRSKTDAADAEVLAEYTRRMPFTAWVAPSLGSMRLRSIVRHVESLSVQSAQNQNRLHAAQGSASTPACIVQDLKRSVGSLELRIHKLRREAMALVRQDDLLRKRFELLVSIPGIAQVSAMQLLAELSTLPSDLTVREWVAHSGLDPAHEMSGSSVRKASRISRAGNRHLRRALYMPALVASRRDPHAKAFFENLVARKKARLQALIAVARKLLHAIYGIFRSGMKYEGTKLFPRITLS